MPNLSDLSDTHKELHMDLYKLLFVLMLVILCIAASFGVGIWVMIVGWGLTANSWSVIIIGALCQMFILTVLGAAKGMFKDED